MDRVLVSAPLETSLNDASEIFWQLDAHPATLFIVTSDFARRTRWVGIGDNDVWLALEGDHELVGICASAIQDENGSLESARLDEIGA